MGTSPMISAIPRSQNSTSTTTSISTLENEAQQFLAVLSDADCRSILAAISADVLTASEISDACGLPLSTTYRKIDSLNDTELIEEEVRICQSGNCISEYTRSVDEIIISLSN